MHGACIGFCQPEPHPIAGGIGGALTLAVEILLGGLTLADCLAARCEEDEPATLTDAEDCISSLLVVAHGLLQLASLMQGSSCRLGEHRHLLLNSVVN